MIIYIYFLIIVICFVLSLIIPKARQNFLWIYFALVLIVEFSFLILKALPYSLYILAMPIYTLFFIFYYSLDYKRKYIHYALAFCAIISSTILFYNSDDNSQIVMGVIMSVIHIFLSLIWFFTQLKKPSLIPIYKKQGFWISTTLLFMGIVFIFRMVPMNIFEVTDKSFLVLINKGFQYAIIASYLLFLKATTCKV